MLRERGKHFSSSPTKTSGIKRTQNSSTATLNARKQRLIADELSASAPLDLVSDLLFYDAYGSWVAIRGSLLAISLSGVAKLISIHLIITSFSVTGCKSFS